EREPRLIVLSRLVERFEDLAREMCGGDDSRERAEAQDPASQRPIVADAEAQAQGSVRQVGHFLRSVPLALTNVIHRLAGELNLYQFRTSRVHTERIREG